MVETAQTLYVQSGMNCAQAIAGAWEIVSGKEVGLVKKMGACGRGRAPGGLCGALHAARLIVGEGKAAALTEKFAAATGGAISCRDILTQRKVSCLECVRLAGELLGEPVAAPVD